MYEKHSLIGTNEIVGAICLTDLYPEQQSQMLDSPRDFIFATTDYKIPEDIEVTALQNSAEQVHLALPYYESVEAARAEILDDADLDVSGGELFITIGALSGVGIGLGVAAGAGLCTGSGIGATILMTVGGITGAVIGGAVAGGIAGGVASAVLNKQRADDERGEGK